MGDRTKIADALDKFDHCTGGWVCPAVAHFHGCHCDDGNCDRPAEHTAVPLRADPDTSNELFTEARRLAERLAAARHYECGDCWYSCPESEEGCCNDAESGCNCSAPERHAAARLIAALLERAVTAEADRDEAERRERTAVNLANYHRDVAREAGRRADAARPPAPTESTPDPPYQPVAGRPTMDLLDRGTDR